MWYLMTAVVRDAEYDLGFETDDDDDDDADADGAMLLSFKNCGEKSGHKKVRWMNQSIKNNN